MPVVSSPRGLPASPRNSVSLSEQAQARPRPKRAPPVPGGRVVSGNRHLLGAVEELSALVDEFDLYARAPLPPTSAPRPAPAAPAASLTPAAPTAPTATALTLQEKINLFERLGYRHIVHLHPGAHSPPPPERAAAEQRGWLQVTQERNQAAFYVPSRQSLPPLYPPPPAYQASVAAPSGRNTPPVCRYRHWPKHAGKAPNKPLCAILEMPLSEQAVTHAPNTTGTLRRQNHVRPIRQRLPVRPT